MSAAPPVALLPNAVAEAATRILGDRIDPHTVQWLEDRRTVVAATRPDGSQVVIKWSRSRQVLFAEWAALAFITDLNLDPPLAPRLLGGDVDAVMIVMERLPPAASLAGLLLGSDRDSARRGLLGLARGLGRLHASTIGRTRAFELARAGLGPTPSVRYHLVRRFPGLLSRVDAWATTMGIARPSGLDDDLHRVWSAVARPGSFVSLVHGDPCPDNNRVYEDHVVLFDFQVAGIDHCLLDAAYLAVPFPSCWCIGRLDESDVGDATNVYREELSAALPEIGDDEVWLPALAEANAFWLLQVAIADFGPALEADDLWGTATLGQRLLDRCDRFAGLAGRAGVLPALADVAGQIDHALRERSPSISPLPDYPALTSPGTPSVATPDWWDPAP